MVLLNISSLNFSVKKKFLLEERIKCTKYLCFSTKCRVNNSFISNNLFIITLRYFDSKEIRDNNVSRLSNVRNHTCVTRLLMNYYHLRLFCPKFYI